MKTTRHHVIICTKGAKRIDLFEVITNPSDNWVEHCAVEFGKWMLDNPGYTLLSSHVSNGNFTVWVDFEMKKIQIEDQVWAYTNPRGQAILSDLRTEDGFYCFQSMGAIDAPEFIATGGSMENIIEGSVSGSDGRYVIGGAVHRY
jgi:hypothetical protein